MKYTKRKSGCTIFPNTNDTAMYTITKKKSNRYIFFPTLVSLLISCVVIYLITNLLSCINPACYNKSLLLGFSGSFLLGFSGSFLSGSNFLSRSLESGILGLGESKILPKCSSFSNKSP